MDEEKALSNSERKQRDNCINAQDKTITSGHVTPLKSPHRQSSSKLAPKPPRYISPTRKQIDKS